MALYPCKECGEMISEEAVTCPHCGCPTGKKKLKLSKLHIIIISVVGFLLLLLLTNPSEKRHTDKIETVLKEVVAQKSGSEGNFLSDMIIKAVVNMGGVKVNSYGLFSLGTIEIDNKSKVLTIGVLGCVFTTVSNEDIEKQIDKMAK